MSIFSGINNPGLDFDQLTAAEMALVQQITLLGDPNADRILFWDDSAGSYQYLEIGSGLSITGTTMTALAGSGIARTIVVTSGDATMGSTANVDYTYLVAGAHTLTLPTAVSNTNRYTIKNNHSAAITVNTTSSQTIDGTTSIQIAPEDSVDIISDNTNWRII